MAIPEDKANPTVEESKPLENNQAGDLKKLSSALGNDQMREDIDALKQSVTYIADKMNEFGTAINGLNSVLSEKVQVGDIPASQIPANAQNEKFKTLLELMHTPIGEKLLNRLDPPPSQTPNPMANILDPSFIVKKMQESFLDDLNTGTSIRQYIQDALKKKATKSIVNQSLANIGTDSDVIDHSP